MIFMYIVIYFTRVKNNTVNIFLGSPGDRGLEGPPGSKGIIFWI